jgi:signal transduction histidine kinase
VLDLEVLPLQEPGHQAIGAVCITGERPDAVSAGVIEAQERADVLARLGHALAHEINNPLTTILGTADALLASAALMPPTRKRLDAIRTSALKIADAVRRLAVQP